MHANESRPDNHKKQSGRIQETSDEKITSQPNPGIWAPISGTGLMGLQRFSKRRTDAGRTLPRLLTQL